MNSFSRLAASAALLLFAGCLSLDRQGNHPKGAAAGDPFAGRWEGRWTSAKHFHSGGRLQCVLKPIEEFVPLKAGTSHYSAHFKAQWLAFSSSYDVALEARRHGRELTFHGEHDLPAMFGGTYRFEGHATPERFVSSYDSSYDHGVFEMTRPR